MLKSDTGRYFSTWRLSPFLKIGEIAAFFQATGIFRRRFMFLKTLWRVSAMAAELDGWLSVWFSRFFNILDSQNSAEIPFPDAEIR